MAPITPSPLPSFGNGFHGNGASAAERRQRADAVMPRSPETSILRKFCFPWPEVRHSRASQPASCARQAVWGRFTRPSAIGVRLAQKLQRSPAGEAPMPPWRRSCRPHPSRNFASLIRTSSGSIPSRRRSCGRPHSRCFAASSPKFDPGRRLRRWDSPATRSTRNATTPSLQKRYLPCSAQGRYRFNQMTGSPVEPEAQSVSRRTLPRLLLMMKVSAGPSPDWT